LSRLLSLFLPRRAVSAELCDQAMQGSLPPEELVEDASSSTKLGVTCAPFNPTNADCIALALDMLEVREGDVVFDLGCGDGRFLVQGCEKVAGISGVGIEYDSALCERARALVRTAGLTERVTILHQNVLDCDISSATAIFVYLVPTGMAAIRAVLEEAIGRGVRVVTYVFSIPGMTPERVEVYKKSTKLHLYTHRASE
jgi:tRNA A58 N-methylase Trm61